jgi:two-component sensor histidine kinase
MSRRSLLGRLPSAKTHGLGPLDARLIPGYLFALAGFAAAFLVRWGLGDILPPGVPYLTFFPAIVAVAFAFGLWPGLAVSVLSGLASWYFFLPPAHSFDLNGSTVLALGFYAITVAVVLTVFNLAIGAMAEGEALTRQNQQLTEFQSILIQELDHRIKNLFSVVASVVKLSARYTDSPEELAEEVTQRIMALGRSHGTLSRLGSNEDATVQSVARLVLEPYLTKHASSISIAGDSGAIGTRIVQLLSLIFHELATNAVKYGALVEPSGRIRISTRTMDGDGGTIVIEWREEGIATPSQADMTRGFGTEMIERLVGSAGGKLEQTFESNAMTTLVMFPRS